MTPADLITAAQALLTRTDPETAGLWPRAAALLGRQALEETLDAFWRTRDVGLDTCSTRPQLICLGSYLNEEVAGRVNHSWSGLSRACHHHPYELAPSVGELAALLDSVNAFQQTVESIPVSKEGKAQ